MPVGRVLGGSSTMNWMMYVRGNRRDFDNWAAMGNPGWSYREVLRYFKKAENYLGTRNNVTGRKKGQKQSVGRREEGRRGVNKGIKRRDIERTVIYKYKRVDNYLGTRNNTINKNRS